MVTLDIGNNKNLIDTKYRNYLSRDYNLMISTIVKLLRNESLRLRLGEESRNYIVKKYSVDVSSKRLKELLLRVL